MKFLLRENDLGMEMGRRKNMAYVREREKACYAWPHEDNPSEPGLAFLWRDLTALATMQTG